MTCFLRGGGGQRGPQPGDTGAASRSTPHVVKRQALCSPQPRPGVSSGTCGLEIPAGGERLSGEALGGPQKEPGESSLKEGFTRLLRHARGAGRPGGERRLEDTREAAPPAHALQGGEGNQSSRLEILGGALGELLQSSRDGRCQRERSLGTRGDGGAGGARGTCWRWLREGGTAAGSSLLTCWSCTPGRSHPEAPPRTCWCAGARRRRARCSRSCGDGRGRANGGSGPTAPRPRRHHSAAPRGQQRQLPKSHR